MSFQNKIYAHAEYFNSTICTTQSTLLIQCKVKDAQIYIICYIRKMIKEWKKCVYDAGVSQVCEDYTKEDNSPSFKSLRCSLVDELFYSAFVQIK